VPGLGPSIVRGALQAPAVVTTFADATKARGCACTPLYHVVIERSDAVDATCRLATPSRPGGSRGNGSLQPPPGVRLQRSFDPFRQVE
jgi:hypothetical protein